MSATLHLKMLLILFKRKIDAFALEVPKVSTSAKSLTRLSICKVPLRQLMEKIFLSSQDLILHKRLFQSIHVTGFLNKIGFVFA